MTQDELRELLIKRVTQNQQKYIAEHAGLNKNTLSRFKRGEIDLHSHLFEKLEKYLLNN